LVTPVADREVPAKLDVRRVARALNEVPAGRPNRARSDGGSSAEYALSTW
jgi:hypothetical protein